MKADFWHDCWKDGRIGFHQDEINPYLQQYLGRLQLPPGARILVPLCGKSLDKLWLAQQGFSVTGVELSQQAIEDFLRENQLDYDVHDHAGVSLYVSGPIEIWCADFFGPNWSSQGRIDAVYDRAALVALPADMRETYAARLAELVERGSEILLVTLEYPEGEMNGPPFSVPQDEVQQLFGSVFEIELLHREDCLLREPRFAKRGVTRMDERVFLLRRI